MTRRFVTTGFLLPVIVLAAVLNTGYASGAESPLQFDAKSLSLGEVDQGVIAKGVVKFQNVGVYPIQLTAVRPACGCMVANFSKSAIAAGGWGQFSVSLSTARRVGECDVDVVVVYDVAGIRKSDRITVSAFSRVEGKLAARPENFYFGERTTGTQVRGSVTIRPLQHSQRPTAIRNIRTPAWLAQELRILPGPESGWELTVHGDVPDGNGLLYQKVTVTTDSRRFPTLEIPVILSVDGEFIRQPRSIVQVLHMGQPVVPSELVMRHAKGVPWRIRRIKLDGLKPTDIRIDKWDTKVSTEKTIRVTAIQPTQTALSMKKGALQIDVDIQGKRESVRIPVLFVWKTDADKTDNTSSQQPSGQ